MLVLQDLQRFNIATLMNSNNLHLYLKDKCFANADLLQDLKIKGDK